jgi:hypothetical protein
MKKKKCRVEWQKEKFLQWQSLRHVSANKNTNRYQDNSLQFIFLLLFHSLT